MGLIVISRGIDLSMISIMAAAWSIPLTQIEAGLSLGAAILLSIFIAVLIGAVNGLIIAFVEAPPLFVTLAASFVIYGLAFWIAPASVVLRLRMLRHCCILGRACCSIFRCPLSCF